MKRFSFSNIAIVLFLILFVCGVMLASFASKSKLYEQTNNAVKLTVQKKEFAIYAQTGGILASSTITVGQHVSKGEVIGLISNAGLDQQIEALSLLTDNASAAVQLSQLKSEKLSQTLTSPTDGIVAIASVQGEAINNAQNVATIYSDNSVQLLGRFSYSNYTLFEQNTSNLIATSLRDSQKYSIRYGGTLQEVSTDQNKDSYVTLFFSFVNPNDAVNVLQGEEMTMRVVRDDGNKKPIDMIKDFFNTSIFSNR